MKQNLKKHSFYAFLKLKIKSYNHNIFSYNMQQKNLKNLLRMI